MADIAVQEINLPEIHTNSESHLGSILETLGVPRSVLASEDEIAQCWLNLPRHLQKIPPEYRNALLARMCVAIQTGLFDAAINYIWNLGIICLRDKVTQFGYAAVRQILEKDLDDSSLSEMQDSKLLELCLKLNLISEEGFYFIDQCRDIRNNFSAAHPPIGTVDDSELISFVNRCCKYIFVQETLIGVDTKKLLETLKVGRFLPEQRDEWVRRIKETHEAQRSSIIATLHGIYCDPSHGEEVRLNSMDLSSELDIDNLATKELNDRHAEYIAKGDEKRAKASREYFEKREILNLLADAEQYKVILSAINNLMSAHLNFNNFYNEPAFAERLSEIVKQMPIPDALQSSFVECVVSARIGNKHGVSRAAAKYYDEIIKNFSPKEIAFLVQLCQKTPGRIKSRWSSYSHCKRNLVKILEVFDTSSIPTGSKDALTHLLEKLSS